MNTDFRLAIGIFRHPKVLRLKMKLGPQAVLSYLALLEFVTINRPDGDLVGMDELDIALAGDWTGEGDFVGALIDLRLLDRDASGITVHDWAEHNPWAAGAERRSESAAVNAFIKHHGRPPTEGEKAQLSANRRQKHAERTAGAAKNAAPSPSPFQSSHKNAQKMGDKSPRSRFVPPGEEEVKAYFSDKGRPDLAEAFRRFYGSNGWKVGKNQMKSWHDAASGWIARDNAKAGASPGRSMAADAGRIFEQATSGRHQ